MLCPSIRMTQGQVCGRSPRRTLVPSSLASTAPVWTASRLPASPASSSQTCRCCGSAMSGSLAHGSEPETCQRHHTPVLRLHAVSRQHVQADDVRLGHQQGRHVDRRLVVLGSDQPHDALELAHRASGVPCAPEQAIVGRARATLANCPTHTHLQAACPPVDRA